MFRGNDNKKWVHFSQKVRRLFGNVLFWGKYGNYETHPYSYICFVVFLKKFFSIYVLKQPKCFFFAKYATLRSRQNSFKSASITWNNKFFTESVQDLQRSCLKNISFFLSSVVASVFLGIRMDAAGLDDSPLYAMIVYCVGVAFVIVFDIYISLEKSDKKKEIFSLAKEVKQGNLTRLLCLFPSFSIVIDNTGCQASSVTSLH